MNKGYLAKLLLNTKYNSEHLFKTCRIKIKLLIVAKHEKTQHWTMIENTEINFKNITLEELLTLLQLLWKK